MFFGYYLVDASLWSWHWNIVEAIAPPPLSLFPSLCVPFSLQKKARKRNFVVWGWIFRPGARRRSFNTQPQWRLVCVQCPFDLKFMSVWYTVYRSRGDEAKEKEGEKERYPLPTTKATCHGKPSPPRLSLHFLKRSSLKSGFFGFSSLSSHPGRSVARQQRQFRSTESDDPYEEWCHIVDKAFFAPNGAQFKMPEIFCIHQRISLRVVSIDRRNAGNFATIKFGTIFKA